MSVGESTFDHLDLRDDLCVQAAWGLFEGVDVNLGNPEPLPYWVGEPSRARTPDGGQHAGDEAFGVWRCASADAAVVIGVLEQRGGGHRRRRMSQRQAVDVVVERQALGSEAGDLEAKAFCKACDSETEVTETKATPLFGPA